MKGCFIKWDVVRGVAKKVPAAGGGAAAGDGLVCGEGSEGEFVEGEVEGFGDSLEGYLAVDDVDAVG